MSSEVTLRAPRARPALGQTGQDLYDATLPLTYAEEDVEHAWAHYLAALSLLLDTIAEIVRSDGEHPGWTALASPSRCPSPWLRVLAQWAGIKRWDSVTEPELREWIGPHAPGMWRGTRAAILAAVRRFLPPGTDLYFEERADGDAYKLRIFTFDFVDHDPDQVRAALRAVIPAGLQLLYEIRSGQTWGMLSDEQPTWGDVADNYTNWGDVGSRHPTL